MPTILIFLLLFLICCGCGNQELTIEPIGQGHGDEGIYYWTVPNIDPYCFERQYYTLSNYKGIAPDSLYSILNEYINSRYSYEEIAENIKHNPACNFTAHFYEKSLFVNYEEYLEAAIMSEMGGIIEFNHKLIAKIYTLGRYDNNNPIFHTVVYNNDNRDSIMLIKSDTVMVFSCKNNSDTFTDSRDGKTYKTVKMPDGNIWMAENLNYETKSSRCYDRIPEHCQQCGRLYSWFEATKICPKGWHLPSYAEWEALTEELAKDEICKESFASIPCGFEIYDCMPFTYGFGDKTSFWSGAYIKNYKGDRFAIIWNLSGSDESEKIHGHSVRCVKD